MTYFGQPSLMSHPIRFIMIGGFLGAGKTTTIGRLAREYQERNPDSATSYYLLGRAYLASGERQKAMTAFNKALELRPGDPGAGSSLADLALSDDDYEAARNYYKQVLEHYPELVSRVPSAFTEAGGSIPALIVSMGLYLLLHRLAFSPADDVPADSVPVRG